VRNLVALGGRQEVHRRFDRGERGKKNTENGEKGEEERGRELMKRY